MIQQLLPDRQVSIRPAEMTGMTRAWFRSWLVPLLLVMGSGVFHGASWVFPGLWQSMWVGHVLLIMLAVICRPSHAFLAGMAVGCIGLGWAFSWAPAALSLCFNASFVGARGIYSTLVVWESVEFGLFCWLSALLLRTGLRGFFGVPFAWTVVEYWWPKIFPWLLGYTQLELLPLVQIAEVTGSLGIGFVITAVAAIPAAFLLWRRNPRSGSESRWLVSYLSAATLLLAGVLGFGFWRLAEWRKELAQAPTLNVAIVQIDPSKVGSEAKLRERTKEFTTPVDLICWPESAIGTYESTLTDFTNRDLTLERSRFSRESVRPAEGFTCDLLAGGRTYHPDAAEEGPFYMTAYLINPSEQIIGRYHKRTLLPFGEYIPGQSHFPEIRRWATLVEVTEAGNDARPLTTSQGARVGVVICYEDLLPLNVRRTAAEGAEILCSLINATAFEQPLTLQQHERIARLRSVENRRFLVRCSSTGITCITSPTGEIVAELELGIEGTLRHDVSLFRDVTIYTRWGDYFPLLCTLMLGLSFAVRSRRRANQKELKESGE